MSLLGLARRAGELTIGVSETRRALSEGSVHLLVVAGDASATQLAKLKGPRRRAGIDARAIPDRETLGRAIGVASASVVGVTSKSFATQLSQRLDPWRQRSSEEESPRRAQEERRSDAGR